VAETSNRYRRALSSVELKFTARPRLARSVRAISDDLITGRDKGDFIAKDRADRARVIKRKRAAGANYTCNNLPGDLQRARARATMRVMRAKAD